SGGRYCARRGPRPSRRCCHRRRQGPRGQPGDTWRQAPLCRCRGTCSAAGSASRDRIMIELTLAEVASAVGGVLHSCVATELITAGVEFDSRRVTPGGLFVALPGERVDGHDFAAAAVAAGAVGVLAGRPVDTAAVLAPRITDPSSGAYALAADTDGA